MYKTNGSTSDASSNKWVAKPSPATIETASTVETIKLLGQQQSNDSKASFADLFGSGMKWLTSGWGNVFDGNTGIDPDKFSSTGNVEVLSTSDFKKQGGLGSLFGALLGGSTGITLGGIASGIGDYFTAKAKNKLDKRRLDIEEKLGEERNAISRLQAEGNVAKQLADTEENKRRTAIESTFMGHTSPIAAVPGVNVEQGLQVARPAPQAEYTSSMPGALGGSSPGLISQGQQRKV